VLSSVDCESITNGRACGSLGSDDGESTRFTNCESVNPETWAPSLCSADRDSLKGLGVGALSDSDGCDMLGGGMLCVTFSDFD